jgi:excisionase family DNA binding protein
MALKDSYVTVSQAAKEMGVSRQTISNWLAEGKLSAEAIGREKLIPREQLVSVGREYWSSIISFSLYTGLWEFLGYKPKEVFVKRLFGDEPAQATVVKPNGKVEYVEIIPQRSKRGRLTAGFKFRKVDRFPSPFKEDMRPDTEVKVKVGRWGEILQLKFRDLRENKDAPEDDNAQEAIK